MSSLASALLIAIFLAAAAATWAAGTTLSRATDAIDSRFDLGAEFGGIVLLAIAGSLPELAITVSAAARGNLGVAAGNLIGGIAMQTMVLVLCDVVVDPKRPLTYLVGALTPVLEGLLVIVVVALVLMGALLKPSTAIGGVVSPASVAIVVFWVGGVFVINRARREKRWTVSMPGSRRGRRTHREPHPEGRQPYAGASTRRVLAMFALASAITLAAGALLEISGSTLADRAGLSGVVFGATVLALVSALPEISSGLAAVRLGDNALAIGDVFGGNAFQLCLFLLADLLAGAPVLPSAGRQNSWLGALGIALTALYAAGIVVRPQRCWARLGPDSIVVAIVFALGIAGLVTL